MQFARDTSNAWIKVARRSAADFFSSGPCGPSGDPVDQVTTLWSNKMGLEGGSGGKRGRRLWMSEGLTLLQLDPLGHPFDPEDQAPTLWISAN
jgi:hypothetical protein